MKAEILGVTASLLILVSFLMKGERKIRVVNIFGAVMFVVYGCYIKSFSTCFLNAMLFFVHIIKLSKLNGGDERGKVKSE